MESAQSELNIIECDHNNNNISSSSSLPSSLALICGGIAGTSVDVCLYPIDTLKTRMQSPQGFLKSGGFKGIYKGLSAAALGSAPGAALFFCGYETFKPIIHQLSLNNNNNVHNNMNNNPIAHSISAGLGEITACLIRVPTEIVKQRLQTGQYNNFNHAIISIYKQQKIKGFYVGYLTTVSREIPFSFIQFPIWERLKILWCQHNNNNSILPWQGALCGSIAGSIAAAATTPLDVIKTRLMLRNDKQNIAYKGFFDVCKRVYRDEGASTFFKGTSARVSWIFIGGFFFFGAYEKSQALLTPLWKQS